MAYDDIIIIKKTTVKGLRVSQRGFHYISVDANLGASIVRGDRSFLIIPYKETIDKGDYLALMDSENPTAAYCDDVFEVSCVVFLPAQYKASGNNALVVGIKRVPGWVFRPGYGDTEEDCIEEA